MSFWSKNEYKYFFIFLAYLFDWDSFVKIDHPVIMIPKTQSWELKVKVIIIPNLRKQPFMN